MPRTSDHECPLSPHPHFQMFQYQGYFYQYQEVFITIGLLGSLYGVLTVLSMISCYALLTRRSGRIQPTAVVLCLTILALFASTTIYVVISIMNYHSNLMQDLADAGNFLWFRYTPERCWNYPSDVLPHWVFQLDLSIEACGSTTTLIVNVILGDAIVCWRACVVWHKNHIVKALCGIFLVATFVLGVIDATQSCPVVDETVDMVNGLSGAYMTPPGALFEGVPVGVAASTLSLSTNMLASLLVAYKAWLHRRHFKGYLVEKIGGSQIEKLLTLLVESGAVYSAIWSVVVAFQVTQYLGLQSNSGMANLPYNFLTYFGLIMNGALVPAIAIYPTIIITLVAFNRSHMERGLSHHLESMPTPQLAITANAVTTSLHESHCRRRSEVLHFDSRQPECDDSLEEAEGRTSGERKAEGTV